MSKNVAIFGCSRGIGFELLKLLADQEDVTVLAFSRNIQPISELNRKNVLAASLDLASSNVREQVVEQMTNWKIKQIDFAVNNAGKLVNKPFLDLTDEDISACYRVNVIGVMESTQAIVPLMMQGGHIVNISSMGGFQGTVKFAGLSAYSTSKAAVCSFTELFAEEYKDSGIRMNCLCLGAVQTEMLEEAFPGYQAPVKPTEMAQFIRDFLFNGHKFFNGKILPVSLTTP